MKRLISMIFIFILITGLCIISVSADETAAVVLNGVELDFDVPPQIINGRTLVPLRVIFESMGAQVEWDEGMQRVTAARGEDVVSLQIGVSVISVNNEKKILDVPPQLINSRTLVPARAVAEGFGASVDWDDKTHTVIITDDTVYNYGALLNTALNMPKPESIRSEFTMRVNMRMSAEEIDTVVSADIKATKSPEAVEADVNMTSGHEGVSAKVYALEEDGAPVLYMITDSVQKSNPQSIENVLNYDYASNRIYFDMADSVKFVGQQENSVKYLVEISGDNIKRLIELSRANTLLPNDTGLDIVIDALNSKNVLNVILWVDKDLARPVKASVDIGSLMNEVFESQGMNTGVVVGEFIIEMEVNSYDTVDSISLPQSTAS